jgi:predicted porin
MKKNNKTITGLAAASLLALPLAAEAVTWDSGDLTVNFHGSLRPSINFEECDAPCAGPWQAPTDDSIDTEKKNTYMTSNFSHFQFDGKYKLNEKNAAIFKLEWKIDISESKNTVSPVDSTVQSSNTLVDFEQYLGLKGGYGMFRAGTILTPYMQSGVKLDPFRRDAIAGRFFVDIYSALHHGTGFGRGRATNTIRYDSPKFLGGLDLQLFYTLDESNNDNHGYGAGLMYDNKTFYGFLQYYDANRNGKSDATKLGGKFRFGKTASIWAQYESDGGLISLSEGLNRPLSSPAGDLINYEGENDVDGADVYVLGADWNINKFQLIGQYGERDDASAAGTTVPNGHKGYLLGGAYRQTKQLYHYAGYLVKDLNTPVADVDKNTRFTVGSTFTW